MKTLNIVRSAAIALIALSSGFATADQWKEDIDGGPYFSPYTPHDEIISVTTGNTHEAPQDHKAVFVPFGTSDILVQATGVTLTTPDSGYYNYEAPDGYKTVFVPVGTPDFMVRVIGVTLITPDSEYYEAPDGLKVVFVPVRTPNTLVKAVGVSLITPERTLTLGGTPEVDTGPWYDFYDLDKDGVIDGKGAEGCVYDPYIKATLDACYGR